jgi:hypothetical protein
MYAGILFSLAEASGGYLAASSFDSSMLVCIAEDISIRYIKPAISDIIVEVTLPEADIARIEEAVALHGKAPLDFKCHLLYTQGEIVAITNNKYVMIKMKSTTMHNHNESD